MQGQSQPSLQRCYDNLIASLQANINWLRNEEVDRDGSSNVSEPCLTWHRNVLASLRSWAVDVREDSGTLNLLESEPISWHIRSSLLQLYDELRHPEYLRKSFNSGLRNPPMGSKTEQSSNEPQQTIRESISNSIFALQDTVEVVRDLMATKNTSGPYKKLKTTIDRVATQQGGELIHIPELIDASENSSSLHEKLADDTNEPKAMTPSNKENSSYFRANYLVATRLAPQTWTEERGSKSSAYASNSPSHRTTGTSITTPEVSTNKPGSHVSGWTPFRQHSSGSEYRRLLDHTGLSFLRRHSTALIISGKVICTHRINSSRYYDEDKNPLSKEMVRALEEALIARSPAEVTQPRISTLGEAFNTNPPPSLEVAHSLTSALSIGEELNLLESTFMLRPAGWFLPGRVLSHLH